MSSRKLGLALLIVAIAVNEWTVAGFLGLQTGVGLPAVRASIKASLKLLLNCQLMGHSELRILVLWDQRKDALTLSKTSMPGMASVPFVTRTHERAALRTASRSR